MMNSIYDYIIWGPSPEGIKRAIQLKNDGKNILLAGKYGFPGGKATESLASLYSESYFRDNGVLEQLLTMIEKMKFGILYRNQPWLLIHPEAVKRACWQLIDQNRIDILFHVIPLQVIQSELITIELFGREGTIILKAQQIDGFPDDRMPGNLMNPVRKRLMTINAFFTKPLPSSLPGFQIKRKIETPVGEYVSMTIRNVPAEEIELTFNRELDLLIKEAWLKYGSRVSIIPVYPVIE